MSEVSISLSGMAATTSSAELFGRGILPEERTLRADGDKAAPSSPRARPPARAPPLRRKPLTRSLPPAQSGQHGGRDDAQARSPRIAAPAITGESRLMATLQAKPVRRREDARLLTGQGNYAADAQPPGMLQAVLVRSPYAHARVAGLDVTAARTMPGVVAVFTAADLTDVAPIPGGINFPRPDGGPGPKNDRPLLATDRVRFLGEP